MGERSLGKLPPTPGLFGAWGGATLQHGSLHLAVSNLFCGPRSRYSKMEQILLPQRHLILLPQRPSKEVTTPHLSCPSTSKNPQDFP